MTQFYHVILDIRSCDFPSCNQNSREPGNEAIMLIWVYVVGAHTTILCKWNLSTITKCSLKCHMQLLEVANKLLDTGPDNWVLAMKYTQMGGFEARSRGYCVISIRNHIWIYWRVHLMTISLSTKVVLAN